MKNRVADVDSGAMCSEERNCGALFCGKYDTQSETQEDPRPLEAQTKSTMTVQYVETKAASPVSPPVQDSKVIDHFPSLEVFQAMLDEALGNQV
ncbi:hypothetical protein HGM15179_006857 [Zosterops borbonicus]|uniref:Uncharacterized protein n=1 Tax=Zosterops borbonicus TaxID=364589 RepID=A0A8K1GLN6_9PASS|nr:hypothetical protein HGM15179_006857 [Zosterops borbonicus]